jgi:hypothetical protein
MKNETEVTNLPTRQSEQQARLFDELTLALSRTTSYDMKSWGSTSAASLPAIGHRRIQNLGTMISSIAKAAGIDGTIDLGKQVWCVIGVVGSSVEDDPKKNAPGVLALALDFVAGSGGYLIPISRCSVSATTYQ